MSAYIQQDDLFISTLTVREHLNFQARLRMDNDIPHKQRMQKVDTVAKEVSAYHIIMEIKIRSYIISNVVYYIYCSFI